MNEISATIPKQPALTPAEDFYRLRVQGIGFIEQMGSARWTDYNTHDPGITILEALCYAITDLAYRIGWDIKDLLAPKPPSADTAHPYPHQAFFTAREILTVNPTTPDDFRRLLIDLDLVRNGWIFCKKCACETIFYGWCDGQGRLSLSYLPPLDLKSKAVWALGLYEALLELEEDPNLGDLNDRKIVSTTVLHDAGGARGIIMELRFPDPSLADRHFWALFLDSDDAFNKENGQSFTVTLTGFGAVKDYDLFTDPALNDAQRDSYLRKHWRTIFYASFEIDLQPGGEKIPIRNAALRIFGDNAARDAATAAGIKTLLENDGRDGFILRYRSKEKLRDVAVASAKASLQAHRNLDEDYCRVKVVGIEEVAVCADVEVKPEADIELVQARIWFEIQQYFNPPVPFYTLQELLDSGEAVEEIFNGPELESGFIRNDDLQKARLKTVLRVSDLIDLLMDIDGVIAINHLQLTKYDSEGKVMKGAADPVFVAGKPVFDANKSSASWLLYITPQHQPRLYLNASRFFFSKNGLPFLPRMDEALDTLTQLRGAADRPKIKSAPKDLLPPLGTFRDVQDYFPVQYSFPLTYGIGRDGLPSEASAKRRAQARQLKGYLLVFEQLLGNAFAQIAHAADLYSLDPAVAASYFVMEFKEEIIQGYNDLNNGLTLAKLKALAESEPEFHERRNRFLDHVMARFGEQFNDYALLLTNLQGQQVALDRLIRDKITFINAYPQISHDRGRAFNYKEIFSDPQRNIPGIKKRISLLLGYPDLAFAWSVTDHGGGAYGVTFQVKDENGTVLLQGGLTITSSNPESVILKAYRAVMARLILPDSYHIDPVGGKFRLSVEDGAGNPLGEAPTPFDTPAAAQAVEDELLGWSAEDRLIVVEHLLLRPKFPGDALYPVCAEGACKTCGEEDPYSFRLTFVMPGWTAPYNTNMELRAFAERTIREETPSHLLPKICWVGDDGFIENLCDPVINDLAELLLTKGETAGGERPEEKDACTCAGAIYQAFSDTFRSWYEDKTLEYIDPATLEADLVALFNGSPDPGTITCTTVLQPLWAEVESIMVAHFHNIALYGWQFERFEDAWYRWLEVNAAIDWTEEHLLEEVEAILTENVQSVSGTGSLKEKVSRDATIVMGQCGTQFNAAMEAAAKTGQAAAVPDFQIDLTTFGDGITFNNDTTQKLKDLLKEPYQLYPEVSYRLWVVVNLLSKLRNTYPPATLHDCDEGNDKNPVRLNITALGK